MQSKRHRLLYILSGLVVLAFVMAYFERAHPPEVELVNYVDVLPDPSRNYLNDTGLADRISHSYGLALVLVISEYSQKNAVALEALRSWAHEQYQHDPSFLHKLVMQPPQEKNYSIVDAFCYSLLAPPRYLIEEHALQFLQSRISAFHQSKAFEVFRFDYFESFGIDREAARLLARYETDKARLSVGVLMSAVYWLSVVGALIIYWFRARAGIRSTKTQRSLAYFWFALSAFYLFIAWSQNTIPLLVSALICLVVALYIRRPIGVSLGVDEGLTFRLLAPATRMITLGCWLTLSMIAIQFLLWIKLGTLNEPDPITLLLSALSGNFVHDPMNSKRIISRFLGCFWLVITAVSLWSVVLGWRGGREIEEELASLREPALKD